MTIQIFKTLYGRPLMGVRCNTEEKEYVGNRPLSAEITAEGIFLTPALLSWPEAQHFRV